MKSDTCTLGIVGFHNVTSIVVTPSSSTDEYYSVSFNEPPEGMWVVSVSVTPTTFHTLEDIVAKQEIQNEFETTIIDAYTTIVGYPAVVVHSHDVYEGTDSSDTTVLFIKDGYYYSISDRTDEPERVRQSFYFE